MILACPCVDVEVYNYEYKPIRSIFVNAIMITVRIFYHVKNQCVFVIIDKLTQSGTVAHGRRRIS
jgi:hypothetical protein